MIVFFFYLHVCMCVCACAWAFVHVCVHMCVCPWRPEEGMRISEAKVAADMGPRSQGQVLLKSRVHLQPLSLLSRPI